MKIVVAFLFVALLAVCQGASLRQLFGTCVEMCSSDADCASGHHCLSNGCGHTCQLRTIFPIHSCGLMMCDLFCANGFATDANGCTLCSCNADPLLGVVQ